MGKYRCGAFAIAMLAGAIGITATNLASADSVTVQPSGEYALIDTRLASETLQVLANASAEDKQKTIAQIKASPDKYAPPVFYALSSVLFEGGEKDQAAFWFYAGQLRARFDANRCADISARESVAALNEEYGTPINEYTLQNLPKLEKLVLQVIEWDKKTPHNYDHRWINLHGMNAMISSLGGTGSSLKSRPVSLPKEQWDEIAETTRVEYLAQFREAMKQAKAQ